MNLVELTESLVKAVAEDKDSVKAKEFSSDNDEYTIIQVMIAESDMGRVIGKKEHLLTQFEQLYKLVHHYKIRKLKLILIVTKKIIIR